MAEDFGRIRRHSGEYPAGLFEIDFTRRYFIENLDYAQIGRDKTHAFLEDRMMRNIMYSNFGIFERMKQSYEAAQERCQQLIGSVDAELQHLQ